MNENTPVIREITNLFLEIREHGLQLAHFLWNFLNVHSSHAFQNSNSFRTWYFKVKCVNKMARSSRTTKTINPRQGNLIPACNVDLHTCLTVQVKNLHVMGHFKDQLQTTLQCAHNLANIVYESIKRVIPWATHYYPRLIILSCCRTSNASLCYSKNEPP